MRPNFLPRVWLLLAAILASQAQASVFDRDDRITESADVHGASAPIGMMWADKLATGFLVSQCHVLSVRHVFEGTAPAIGRRAVFGGVATDPHALDRKLGHGGCRRRSWAIPRTMMQLARPTGC